MTQIEKKVICLFVVSGFVSVCVGWPMAVHTAKIVMEYWGG